LSNAEREELVMRNVAKLVKVPTPRYKIGKGLTVAQAKTLLDAAKETRWYALYVTAATLGLRHGELLGLRWQDIDVGRATLTVAQTVARAAGQLYVGPAKSDASEATIPLPKVTRRVLEAHRRRQDDERPAAHRWEDHDLVFPSTIGTPMEPRNLNRHFEGLRVTAGLPDVRLHDLRHTVVSLLLDLGTPPHVVQAIARHAPRGHHDGDLRPHQPRRHAPGARRHRVGGPVRAVAEVVAEGAATDQRAVPANPLVTGGGQGRGRTADLSLFRRSLVPTELPGLVGDRTETARARPCDPDGTRTRDLRRDRATR
jgi:integrase